MEKKYSITVKRVVYDTCEVSAKTELEAVMKAGNQVLEKDWTKDMPLFEFEVRKLRSWKNVVKKALVLW